MLKQLHYNRIYPYLTYGAMSWAITYTTILIKIRTKQNKCIRSIVFASHMESNNYFKLLGILKFDNIVTLKIGTFANQLSNNSSNVHTIFRDYLTSASSVHKYNTRL